MAVVEVKDFQQPDESRDVSNGKLSTVSSPAGAMTLTVLNPGWRWSKDVKPIVGTEWCEIEHYKYVVSGRFRLRSKDGEEWTAGPGEVFYVAPGHDGWVDGDEPLVTLTFGAEENFARPPQ